MRHVSLIGHLESARKKERKKESVLLLNFFRDLIIY